MPVLAPPRKETLNVKLDYGAKGDTKQVNDGAMTSGSAVLNSATAGFTAADVGKLVTVSRATSTVTRLSTTILSYQSATQVTMAARAVAGTGLTILVDAGNKTFTDGVTTNDSAVINSATGTFAASDVGKQITVTNALAVALNTTIVGYTDAQHVTLNDAATRTCSVEQVIYGTDDSVAFQNMLSDARTRSPATGYAPKGWYFCKSFTNNVAGQQIYGGTLFRGDGWGTVIRMQGLLTTDAWKDHGDLFAVNPWSQGTSDPSQNEKGITIRDMHWQGSVVEDGFYQWRYLLSLNAASDVLVENMKFSGFQGDCIYLGSGESASTLERHNQRIKIQNCLFDGINRDNRNGVSVIDGDEVVIDGCSFINCTRDNMPGCIDWEPNANTFSIVRGIRVDNCDFTFCGGNSGHVGMTMGLQQSQMTTPMRGFTITNSVFRAGVSNQIGFFFLQFQYPGESTPRHDIVVAHNEFYDLNYTCELDGVKGADIHDNVFTNSGAAAMLGYQQKSLDVSFHDNTFVGCGNWEGYVFDITNCDRAEIDHNIFDNCGISDLSQGIIVGFKNGSGFGQPTSIVATPSTTGGTLGAATRSYRLTSFGDGTKETLPTTAVTAVTTGSTASVALTWVADSSAAGTKVYGRTGGSELLMATLGPGVGTWTDTGAVTPSGALPGADTSARGSSNGVAFTNNVVRLGASVRTTKIALLTANHATVQNALDFWNNTIPGGTVASAISPFQDSTNIYTVAAASLTVDVSTVPNQGVVTINTSATSNTSLTVSNGWVGQIVTFDWVITGASQVYAFAAAMKFNAATAPTKSVTAGRHDTVTFRFDGTSWNELARAINVG